MKKVVLSFILLGLMFSVYAQDISVASWDKDTYVYWFYVKAEIKKDKELKRPVYAVRRFGKDIKSNIVRKFEKDVWRNLNNGNQLAIGPFLEYADAIRANMAFDLGRKSKDQIEKEINAYKDTTDNVYYWYVLQFTKSKRTNSFLIKRQPARIAEGTFKQFREFMVEGLSAKQLAVGPFTSQEEAETSKRLYRLEDSF